MSAIHQIVARLQAHKIEALTHDQFKKWPSAKRRQYLKDHPNSKFQEGNKVTDRTRDPATNRLKRTLPKNKDANQVHPGAAKYHFTDTTGKKHTYHNHDDVARHHGAASKRLDQLDKSIDKIEDAHKNGKPMTPAVHKRYQALMNEYHHLHDTESTLGKLQRNSTYKKEMTSGPALEKRFGKTAMDRASGKAKPNLPKSAAPKAAPAKKR